MVNIRHIYSQGTIFPNVEVEPNLQTLSSLFNTASFTERWLS